MPEDITEQPRALEQPEADTLDQRRPTVPERPPEEAKQAEASDGDLADQAREIGPDEDVDRR